MPTFPATGRWSDARHPDTEGNLFREIVTRCKILFDGVDVTSDCFYFHEDSGLVGLYLRDENGQRYPVPGCDEAAISYRRGKFELILE